MAIAMMTMTTTATTWVVWFDGMIAGFRFVGLMGWIVECDMTWQVYCHQTTWREQWAVICSVRGHLHHLHQHKPATLVPLKTLFRRFYVVFISLVVLCHLCLGLKRYVRSSLLSLMSGQATSSGSPQLDHWHHGLNHESQDHTECLVTVNHGLLMGSFDDWFGNSSVATRRYITIIRS